MKIVLLIVVLLIVYLHVEFLRLLFTRQKISTRILVTGSRGKSSVTRLIAAGLRANNNKVLAKVTGSETRLIHPDGHETALSRWGMASILEQIKLLHIAAKQNMTVLVTESMALRPQLLRTESLEIIKPHIMALCTIAPDHLDITAPTVDGLYKAFAGVIPAECRVVTTNALDVEKTAIHNKHANIKHADELASIDIKRFSYIEHVENVRLALAVCAELGIEQDKALAGMYQVQPDPGALQVFRTTINDQPVNLVLAFAANDPQSITNIRANLKDQFTGQLGIVFNTRSDRPFRSRQFLNFILKELNPVFCLVTGSGNTGYIMGRLKRGKVPSVYCHNAGVIQKELIKQVAQPVTVLGLGNYGGTAKEWLQMLDKH